MMPAAAPGSLIAPGRRIRLNTYIIFFAAFTAVVVLIHLPFLSLPYFWDEMGQFVPAALDILHDGSWIPHSAVPNVHPPGVMAYLAAVWQVFGYSITSTRGAMLLLASLTVFCTFLLAIQLCRGLHGTPGFIAVLLLVADPLFYTQSMMAQLDMPAALFTVLALLLFLQDRHVPAALSCTLLVMAKETGVLLPLICILALAVDNSRRRYIALYLAPILVLAAWLLILWRSTGHVFGNPDFARYNLTYALHPVRIALTIVRRLYFVFVDQFRWLGTLAVLFAARRSKIYFNRAWAITWGFITAHLLLVTFLGGAELERYVLPVLPLIYIAMAAAWTTFLPRWRNASVGISCAGLLAGMFINPPFPFPYENNLAMADFVKLQQTAAAVLDRSFYKRRIYTAWPLTQALRDPAFGYVERALNVHETSDLRYSTLRSIDPRNIDILVLYSRTWEPDWGVLRFPLVRRFLTHFYQYGPQMDSEQVLDHFGLVPVLRWTERGQWIEIYARS